MEYLVFSLHLIVIMALLKSQLGLNIFFPAVA